MKLKVGYSTYTWVVYNRPKPYAVEKALDEIKLAGFRGVEIDGSPEVLGDPKKLKQALLERDMSFPVFEAGVGLHQKNDPLLQQAKVRVDYAANFEVRIICVCGGFPEEGENLLEDHFKILAENLEELAEYAAQYQIDVAFHPHLRCRVETSEDTAKLFELTKSTKLCLDTAHLAVAGSDPVQMINDFSDRLIYVHLKDWSKGLDFFPWGDFVEPGQGDVQIDFSAFFSALEAIDYDGWSMIELDRTRWTPLKSAQITSKFLDKYTMFEY